MPKLANDRDSSPKLVRRVMSPENAEKAKEILRQVVLQGTAKGKDRADSALYTTAGKTASSYDPDLTEWDLEHGLKKSNFASSIGFAPVSKPQIEIYVGLNEPKTDKSGSHGGSHAAPVFRKLAEEVLQHMKVAPDKPQT